MSITYVSIDSKDRNKESKYIYNNKISNIYNKASIEQNSNELKLNSYNHELNNGNKVSLEVVEASSYTLQNPFIYKNYNGTIFVYVYQPNVIDTVPLFDPNRNSILNIVIEDFEYPSGTATFNVLTNNGTLELELSSLTHNLGSSENLTDLLKLNDKIQLDIDSDFISNNQIYTVYHLDTTTKIARVRCTHPKVEKFNSTTCQWSFVNTLNNQNTIADIHSYFHLIQPPRLLYLEYSEFDALGLSDGWFLDWYKFELPSFISHSVSANTLIKNIKFGGNVKIKLDTGIVHLSNNPLIITKNSNEITLMDNNWEFITELNQSDPINNPWNGTGESGSPSISVPLNKLSSSNGQDLEIKIEWDNNLVNKIRVEINIADWGDYETNTNNLYYGANPGGRCLNIAEIKVFNQDGVNVATGATSQSSTFTGSYYGSGDYAIDGNTGTFNHTETGDGWLEVELSSLSVVSSIELTNRNTYNARDGADQNQIARVPTQIKLLDVKNNVLKTIIPTSWSTDQQTFTFTKQEQKNFYTTTSTRYFKGWPLDIVFDYTRTTSSTNYTVSAKKTLEEDWVTRTQHIYKDGDNRWNWSFNSGMGSLTLGTNDSFGWKNYGFLLYGHNDPIKETAYFLFAGTDENKPLEAYEYNMSWSKVRVYARLISELNSAIHSDEVELHNIQPVSNVISSMEAIETKTYLKFTHDDLNKNFPVNLDILVNNYITFDFSESLTSVIAFKDGGLINNDNTNSFRVLKVNVFKQITLDLLYEIDTDLSYITNGLKWTAVINNTPYKGYVKTPIEYLPKEINQIKVGLGDSNISKDIKLKHSIFFDSGISNYDLTGNSTVTLHNSPTVDADGINLVRASSQYADMGTTRFGESFTISVWVNVHSYSTWQRIFNFSTDVGSNHINLGEWAGLQKLSAQVYENGAILLHNVSNIPYNTNEWMYITFVSNTSSGYSIYINGSNANISATTPNGATFPSIKDRNKSWIGNGIDGQIKSVNIWERALSSNEIKFIYNQGRNYNVYSNINYEKTYIDNVFMKITLGNTTNKSGFKINTTGVNVGDNVEITTDTTDYIEFGDGSRIDNLNLADSIIQEKLWTKYTIKGTGTRTFVFNQSITFTNKANDSVNGIIYSNIPVDINNTYRVTVTGSSSVPTYIWNNSILKDIKHSIFFDTGISNYDLTGNSTVTLHNNPTVDADGINLVRTSSQYAQLVDTNFGGNQVTISIWANFHSNNNWQRLIDFGLAPSNNNVLIANRDTSGKLTLEYFNGSTKKILLDSAASISYGSWLHVCVVYNHDATTCTLYVNGVSDASVTTTEAMFTIERTKSYIGRSNWNDPYFDGQIKSINIWERALSSNEIKFMYDQGRNYNLYSSSLSTTSSTISSELYTTSETLDIGVVFNTGTAIDSTFNITSVLLQQKVNQQFEVVAKSGNDLTLNAQKVITDIDSSNASFKVNGNIATIDKTPIDITKTGNNKNPNVSINDINIKINRSSSIITYLDDEVESRSVVNGTIFDYKDTYVLIKLEKDIKSITLSGTPTFEFVGPDRVLYTGEINTTNIVSEANSYFFRNMIDTSDKLKFNNVGINFKTEALNSNTAFDIVDFDYAKDEATINLNREIKNIDVINDNLEDINIVHLNNISSTEQANWSLFMNDFNTNYKVIGSNATSLRLQGNVINKHNVYRFGGRFGWLKWKDNIGGIHNDFLNADLPQLNKKQAYHQVTNVNGHDFSIILSDNAKVGVVNGGHHIRIKQIMDNLVGYPNPNSYRIYLKNPLTNVVSVNMESTEFTNTSFIITDSNNKIYWQNELDGDYVYNVTLDNGYYYFDTLATEIQNKMGKVNRIYDAEGVTHKILANVNTDTQEFTLQSYNETILYNPVSTSENSRVITISHNNHGFSTGDIITIFDSLSVGRIPSTQINSEHEIIVLNDNAYTINVTTPSDSALLDQGGTIFAVLSYNKIRLRLDYENTIGNILGFDNTDIQDFSIKVSNKDYNKGLKHMNLFGNRYILMKCKTDKDFGVLQTNSLRNIFAKIQLSEIINNNVFNSFISRLKVFTDPITIEFIDIELYDENGKLFDFSDLDHSFTISVEQKIQ